MYHKYFKRLMDLVTAILALLIFSPIILLLAVVFFVANSGQPFFTQIRPGKNTKTFRLIKFKTMNDKCGADGKLLPDKDRLTPIGKFVRTTSLDELPQLFNVLIGDMSLVGPRPLLVRYLPLYDIFQARRHEVRPGITGWAQINGRNAIDWPRRFELDVYYVDHLSFFLDMRILFLTIKKIFVREGITATGSATMEAFKGN